MKQLRCEMCGSSDLIRQNGVFICQACGSKFSIDKEDQSWSENLVQGLSLGKNFNCKLSSEEGKKGWLASLLLCLFFGGLGIHRFYTGYIVIGIVQLLTAGGCGIWTLIDFICICCDSYTDANGNKLSKNVIF